MREETFWALGKEWTFQLLENSLSRGFPYFTAQYHHCVHRRKESSNRFSVSYLKDVFLIRCLKKKIIKSNKYIPKTGIFLFII